MTALNRAHQEKIQCRTDNLDINLSSQHHLQVKLSVCMPAILPVKCFGCSLALWSVAWPELSMQALMSTYIK